MELTSTAAQELIKMGFPGLVIVGLSFAVVKLWQRVQELQDQRIEDAHRAIPILENVTDTNEKLAEVITALKSTIEARVRR